MHAAEGQISPGTAATLSVSWDFLSAPSSKVKMGLLPQRLLAEQNPCSPPTSQPQSAASVACLSSAHEPCVSSHSCSAVRGRQSFDLNGGVWKQRQGSTGSSAGSRESREASDVPYSELLPLFRRRQLAHAQDEEQRRSSGHDAGDALAVLLSSLRHGGCCQQLAQ